MASRTASMRSIASASSSGPDDARGVPERIELERRVALPDDDPRGRRHRLGRALDLVPAVGVDAHAIAHPAAHERVHGLADALADDVPAGDLDRRERRPVDLPAVGVDVAVHALGEQLDLGRIEPDVGVLELVDGGRDRLGERVRGALAHAVDALVGLQPDEHPVLPGIADRVRLRRRDAHFAGSSQPAAAAPPRTAGSRRKTTQCPPGPLHPIGRMVECRWPPRNEGDKVSEIDQSTGFNRRRMMQAALAGGAGALALPAFAPGGARRLHGQVPVAPEVAVRLRQPRDDEPVLRAHALRRRGRVHDDEHHLPVDGLAERRRPPR